jgi:hypothetical protein
MAFHHNADNRGDKYRETCLDQELLKKWLNLNSWKVMKSR